MLSTLSLAIPPTNVLLSIDTVAATVDLTVDMEDTVVMDMEATVVMEITVDMGATGDMAVTVEAKRIVA